MPNTSAVRLPGPVLYQRGTRARSFTSRLGRPDPPLAPACCSSSGFCSRGLPNPRSSIELAATRAMRSSGSYSALASRSALFLERTRRTQHTGLRRLGRSLDGCQQCCDLCGVQRGGAQPSSSRAGPRCCRPRRTAASSSQVAEADAPGESLERQAVCRMTVSR